MTRQRGAAAGRAHPAVAAPGPSRAEARKERLRAGPGARPGETAGAEGAGAVPGGPRRTRGACLRVWGWQGEWVRGRRRDWRSRVPGGPAPVRALPEGLGVCGAVCVRAHVCGEGPLGVYLRMRWAVIVPAPRAGLRGDVFQTGFLRRWALLQPQPEGGAPPPQASRDQGGPGTADRHLREGGGAHQGGVQRPARRVSRDGETEADGWAEEDGQTDGDEEEGGKRDAEKDSPGGERVIEKKRQTEA